MTVDATMISRVSPFTVSPTGDMTADDLAYYASVAKLQLDDEDPGLDSTMYDYCHALLICHLFFSSKGNLDLKSENIGGKHSYSKDTGVTSWSIQYNQIIKDKRKALIKSNRSTDVTERCDVHMPELQLDQSRVPTYPKLQTTDQYYPPDYEFLRGYDDDTN
jgi:hypothetical protein